MSSVYLRLLIFLPAILSPTCVLSSLAFHMMYPAHKLNKQGDNIQHWHTPFPICNESVVPCPVQTVASWPADFLTIQISQETGQVVGHSHFFKNFPQFVSIHIVKVFGVVFLELSCFFDDPIHSVQFSCSVMSDSLWPHGLQLTKLPCPSPTPRVYSNSRPYSLWFHPTISSSVFPFSSCLQSFPTPGSFQMS